MAAAQLRHLQRLASRLVGTRASARAGGFTFSTVQRASHRAAARTSWAAVAVPSWQGRRPLTVSAVDEGRAGGSGSGAAAADYGEQADLQLPTHCSGCGVELQQADPEGPGWVLPALAACWAAIHYTACCISGASRLAGLMFQITSLAAVCFWVLLLPLLQVLPSAQAAAGAAGCAGGN